MKEEKRTNSEEYKCVKYETRRACDTCDGFGRNLNDKINTEECYIPNKNSIIYLNDNDNFPRA